MAEGAGGAPGAGVSPGGGPAAPGAGVSPGGGPAAPGAGVSPAGGPGPGVGGAAGPHAPHGVNVIERWGPCTISRQKSGGVRVWWRNEDTMVNTVD